MFHRSHVVLTLLIFAICSPARAESLLATISASFSDVWSERPFSVLAALDYDHPFGAVSTSVAEGSTTAATPQIVEYFDTLLRTEPSNLDWVFIANAYYDGSSPVYGGGGPNAIDLQAMGKTLTSVELTVTNVVVEQLVLDGGNFVIDTYDFEARLNLYAIPEPGTLSIGMIAVALVGWSARRPRRAVS